MLLRRSSIGLLSLAVAACGSSATEEPCASLEGHYEGTFSVSSQGDCGPADTFEASATAVDVTVTNGSVYVVGGPASCQGEIEASCTQTTLAGVCGGTTAIGAKSYPDLSRVSFGAGGSILVTNMNEMPSSSQIQCILEVQFVGQKTR